MDIVLAGIIGIVVLIIGLIAAYLGGLIAWYSAKKSWFQLSVPRQQWVAICVALGFVSGLGGGLFGAELAAARCLPWSTSGFSQVTDLSHALALLF